MAKTSNGNTGTEGHQLVDETANPQAYDYAQPSRATVRYGLVSSESIEYQASHR
jgi:hypothetical protein